MFNFKRNCCDGIYNSIDVHFTKACDNDCGYCIDKKYNGMGYDKPNIKAITDKIIEISNRFDDVLFLGGEPCLYLEELIECVEILRRETKLKIYVTTSVPKICFDNKERFEYLISILDGINLSVQHHNSDIADDIRRTKSKYDRNSFYDSLKNKHKIRINLNLVKPHLYTKEQLIDCLCFFDKMGFNSIKLSEIQHGKDFFVSFEKMFNIKMGSPYYYGCQTYINLSDYITGFKTKFLLKRSCFACEETLKASLMDGIKVFYKTYINNKKTNNYCVIYNNGEVTNGWV